MLADRLRGIDGVAQVDVNGSLNRELSVLLHAQKLREYNVSVSDVVNALRMQNTTAPVGRVKGELDEQSIRLVGRIESPGGVQRRRRQAPGQRSRPARTGGDRRGRRRGAGRIFAAQFAPQRRPDGHSFARFEHRGRGRTRAQGSRGDQQDAA